MAGGVIDGDAWRRSRLAALESALRTDVDPEQRAMIETELVELRAALGAGRRRWARWLLWGGRPR